MSDNYGNNYGAVLFDMDGVLIDSMSFHVRAYNDVLSKYGLSVSEL
jgi:beta-phosphoglucomutase-like phosphatase (HAD superfamily)